MAKKNNSLKEFFFQNVDVKSIKYDDNITLILEIFKVT